MSVKKTTNLDHDVERKSKALENLKIDASSFESIKHIKGIFSNLFLVLFGFELIFIVVAQCL